MPKSFKSINALYCCLAFIIFPVFVMAQDTIIKNYSCPPKTIMELFKKKDSLLVVKPVKNSFFLLIPIVLSQPATGFMFGGVAQYTFKGEDVKDKYSIANIGATYSTKKQLMINLKNSILLKGNKVFLNGDCRLYIFSQPNYGLSTGILPPKSDISISSIEEPMDYNYFKFHQTASWKVAPDFYVGGGINIDSYWDIDDKQLDVPNGQFTYHYNYSQKYGFDTTKYFVNGVSLNVTYDSRDNQVNARSGWFANINYRINPDIFNDGNHSSVLYGEYRNFIPVSKKRDDYVLALWAYGQFVVGGKVPYLNLPANGWDQRSRSSEGYTQGLFRGSNLVYLSTEFRFPITCNQLLAGTVFTNFITASDKDADVKLFQYIQPAVGAGLRILIDKATRTNIILDYAKGHNSDGFYLNAGETF